MGVVGVVQCTAKSRTSGERCARRVRGGGVCHWHGGSAPQVKAKRLARIEAAEAAARGELDVSGKSPGEILEFSMHKTAEIAQLLVQRFQADGDVDAEALVVIRPWLEQAGKISKAALDAGVDRRRLELVEREQVQLGQVVSLVLAACGVSVDSDDVRAWVRLAAARVGEGDLSPLPKVLEGGSEELIAEVVEDVPEGGERARL